MNQGKILYFPDFLNPQDLDKFVTFWGAACNIVCIYIEYCILSTEFVTIMQKQFTQQCDYKMKTLKLQGTPFSKT